MFRPISFSGNNSFFQKVKLNTNVIKNNFAVNSSTFSLPSLNANSNRFLNTQNPPSRKKKTTQLKEMIKSKEISFLMEAHNGLSARIVEETGFKGIWASGLSISAAMGVRDSNEASWTQVLEVVEFMSDNTAVPILLDGDTGYGNFNNARRLVRKLEQRGVAGVCIEDKLFPKTNSFIGDSQPLADTAEFCGKITAMKEAQMDPDFQVVARVEAFIAGWPLEEALNRAEAYRRAGADAVLIHSKKADPSDIEAFMHQWGNRHPVVIVPTKYYKTPTDVFRKLGISTIIWANHNVRASILAMQQMSKQIFEQESILQAEKAIVSVNEVFRLQREDELRIAEEKYLPKDSWKSSDSVDTKNVQTETKKEVLGKKAETIQNT